MSQPRSSTRPDDLSGAWCNTDAVVSSLFEAISFATPVIEKFLIQTVIEVLRTPVEPEMRDRCRRFIREEATHSSAHNGLNRKLVQYLGSAPPCVRRLERALALARSRLPLATRLLLVATLEHFAAVLSDAYLELERSLQFRCEHAKALFGWHAREELAHRAAVFDLCVQVCNPRPLARLAALLTVLAGGGLYVLAAAIWILHRKLGRRVLRTLWRVAFLAPPRTRTIAAAGEIASELLRFADRDYNPRETASASTDRLTSSRSIAKSP